MSSNKSKIIERQPPKQGRIYSTFKYAIKIPSGITPSQFDAWQTSEWTKASLLDSRGLPTRDVTIQRVGKIGKGQNSKLHITVSPLKSHDSSKWPVRFWGIPHVTVPYPKSEWTLEPKKNYEKEDFNQWDAKVKEGFEGKDQWGRVKRWTKTSASKKGLMVWVKEKPLDVIEEESLSETPARSDGSLSVLYNDHDPQSTLASSTLETTMLGASSRESTLPTFSPVLRHSPDTNERATSAAHTATKIPTIMGIQRPVDPRFSYNSNVVKRPRLIDGSGQEPSSAYPGSPLPPPLAASPQPAPPNTQAMRAISPERHDKPRTSSVPPTSHTESSQSTTFVPSIGIISRPPTATISASSSISSLHFQDKPTTPFSLTGVKPCIMPDNPADESKPSSLNISTNSLHSQTPPSFRSSSLPVPLDTTKASHDPIKSRIIDKKKQLQSWRSLMEEFPSMSNTFTMQIERNERELQTLEMELEKASKY
ncbi:hypothetical protein C349_06466 [Cryptococcus neoformans var. grubii Br795]|nr:hypothetical protein C355_06401 [Cryptococcus neoformans var. grubii Th84]OXG73602.1 hypothetical protein C349_06466 [Cryptococcus neoformans var. grubii Br795]OXH01150.1 hypothetical protein J010_06391 [Cryptococcus neoformans var. grubii]OXH23110.1 hypothetical protein J009_06373 [Cryptococcus neoformans var. grubii]OXH42910.1 hypothetical protein J004_06397 [Cryptococcus neoformans var. grubii]